MTDMALYCRQDGLLEPRAEASIKFVKDHAGQMTIADIAQNIRSSYKIVTFGAGYIQEKKKKNCMMLGSPSTELLGPST